ncbi:hypothetical protein ASPZODRAFT_15721 [Penicilliopsis zonata CBS 506.65]|uniref:Zn(2)-C6 fungal-type domain-containing protein n=1 Tax=Penicilliopsis zonata CBS 506.65 TaxID=1073090 RepID=A0A1L9SIR5_9EURO|nr:hypothetical protein ASPZODRAFT_15721 [Penicilliopsis zonata CBS 506.65]OJJ47037.1 hypothetical protein ASPZODRAFT_15721 [Penicilliopsis zonata CBS 506.65]
MRSRTGCLTCRQRKLKCDEQKPQCSQCRRGARECRPSEGIVFRHQQNASMNKDGDQAGDRGSLNGFYSYKNTFDEDSVWLEIPKHVIFVDNSDPYAEDLEATIRESEAAVHLANSHNQDWEMGSAAERQGLEALSAAATQNRFAFHQLAVDHHQAMVVAEPVSFTTPAVELPPTVTSVSSGPSPTNATNSAFPPAAMASPSISISSANNNNTDNINNNNNSNNNINFLLNPTQSLSPSIDPSIQITGEHRRNPSYTPRSITPRGTAIVSGYRLDPDPETHREIAFLLRHFSEAPGLWMDLFDLGTYFASYVPVKAAKNPLLKYAACAYAAKQLGRVKGARGSVGGVSSWQAFMETWPDTEKRDWCWCGAKYYEKAIQLLMKELQPDAEGPPPPSTPEAFGQWQASKVRDGDDDDDDDGDGDSEPTPRKRQRFVVDSRLSNGVHSDEVLAATAILSVYEFLDATGPAWSRHLSGVKSLLDVAEVGMMPLEQRASTKKSGLSKARKATFWNFARQDYLAAFINKTQTRLNTDDLVLWTEAGLQIDNLGFVRPSNSYATGYPEGDGVMKEDLISNALIWILSKIVNLISASADRTLSPQVFRDRRYRLEAELNAWYAGLPDTFQPCARVEPPSTNNNPTTTTSTLGDVSPFTEIWYSVTMCGSTMQHYHLGRILLLLHNPDLKGNVPNRQYSGTLRYHSYEIVGISLGRPDGAVRINSLQPLFVSGQCLRERRERHVVLNLLRGIEADLGWATGYRVSQLLEEWRA